MKSLIISLLVLLSTCICLPVQGNIYYMSTNGLSIPPYDSLQNAATNFDEVWNYIMNSTNTDYTDGDICFVDSGTYFVTNTIVINPFSNTNITIQSINGAEETIIDCSKLSNGFIDDNRGTIDGFTICNYSNNYNMINNRNIIKNCIFINNNSIIWGHIWNIGTVQNCIFWNNQGRIENREGDFLNCTFVNNREFNYNESYDYSPIQNYGLFENCISISNNNSDLYTYYGTIIRNSIFTTTNIQIGAIDYNSDYPVFENLIYTNNAGFVSDHSFRQIKVGGSSFTIPNFRLSSNSVCIDRGYLRSFMTNEVDVYMNSRVIGSTIDIGAAEFGASEKLRPFSGGSFKKYIRVMWKKDRTGRNVRWETYRGETNDFSSAQLVSQINDKDCNYWDDYSINLIPGQKYYYWIKKYYLDDSEVITGYSCNGRLHSANSFTNYGVYARSDKSVYSSGDNIAVGVSLFPDSYTGQLADWWVVANANGVWYQMDSSNHWVPFNGNPTLQANLGQFNLHKIIDSTLPNGTYTFYFGVDSPNGVIDSYIIYDSVTVQVQ